MTKVKKKHWTAYLVELAALFGCLLAVLLVVTRVVAEVIVYSKVHESVDDLQTALLGLWWSIPALLGIYALTKNVLKSLRGQE